MAKYSEAQNRATQKYINKAYDQIVIRVPKGSRQKYKDLADRKGTSINALVIELLDKELRGV